MPRVSEILRKDAANERQVVSVFRGARAVTIRAAKSLAELKLNNSQTLQRLVGLAVVRKAGPERYFLDEAVWATRNAMSGRTALRVAVVLVLAAAIAAAYYLIG